MGKILMEDQMVQIGKKIRWYKLGGRGDGGNGKLDGTVQEGSLFRSRHTDMHASKHSFVHSLILNAEPRCAIPLTC